MALSKAEALPSAALMAWAFTCARYSVKFLFLTSIIRMFDTPYSSIAAISESALSKVATIIL